MLVGIAEFEQSQNRLHVTVQPVCHAVAIVHFLFVNDDASQPLESVRGASLNELEKLKGRCSRLCAIEDNAV
jgi:hypothetical protein